VGKVYELEFNKITIALIPEIDYNQEVDINKKTENQAVRKIL
ncbi:hypothetical protein Tco_0554977, partial [Tanacetum coccineum]